MVEVRMAQGKVDAILALRAYLHMHAEGGLPGKPSPLKMLTNIFRFMNGPDSALLLAVDGETFVGVLALAKCAFWFSEIDYFIEDKGLYVIPEARGGEALKALLEAAKQTSDDAGLPVFITINSGLRKRGSRSGWERVGATLGYVNRGATLAHFPPEN